MKVITTNLLNRFWKNGIKPIKDALAGKLDTSRIVNSLLTTEAGFALDARQGKELKDQVDELNSNLGFEYGVDDNRYYKKYNNGLLEMWGSVVVDKTGYGVANFPMSYAITSGYRVFITPYYSATNPVMICSAQHRSASSCNIYGRTHDGKVPSGDVTVWWHSIGYWK